MIHHQVYLFCISINLGCVLNGWFLFVGVCGWAKADRLNELEAQIQGPEGSPYEKGIFKLSISIPDRYPFEPPKVRFVTPIYHPNIDSAGRICLDTLKMRPKGSWLPSVNLCTLLTTLRLLLAEPNPDDGLMADIVSTRSEFRCCRIAQNSQLNVLHLLCSLLWLCCPMPDQPVQAKLCNVCPKSHRKH